MISCIVSNQMSYFINYNLSQKSIKKCNLNGIVKRLFTSKTSNGIQKKKAIIVTGGESKVIAPEIFKRALEKDYKVYACTRSSSPQKAKGVIWLNVRI